MVLFLLLVVVGLGKIISSILSAKSSYSTEPFKQWCKRRVIYFSSAIVSVIAFVFGEISLVYAWGNFGMFFGTGFIAVIARPCSFEIFNKSKSLKLIRNLFWLSLGVVSIFFI